MRVDGRCHCGAISFEAEVDPETTGICHCTDCQGLTGTAFRVTVRAPADRFVLRGKPTIYVKTADSGRRRAHAFCPTCGSPIYATSADDPKFYGLRVGTLRQRRELRPRRQSWCASALPWSSDLEELGPERHQHQPS
ncbi:MAG TPA: GFA family protein [Myxococcaceae bacterium]|nr:GFA family protein [Myxococcaceae bacterium]